MGDQVAGQEELLIDRASSLTSQPGIVQDPGEVALVLHSRVSGPISELTFLQKSLLFAELSMVSYNDPREATEAATKMGFPDVTFFDHDGSQAFRFRNEFDAVVACRGTEPHEWNDIRADVNAAAALGETVGRVHKGFKREVDDLWPMLETALLENQLPLWFCGHSLGGAMATICAGRCFLSHIDSNPAALFTYGSPRVGDKRYVNFVKLDHYRFVNNNDIVTRVPPRWLGYAHAGTEVYIDRTGKLGHLNMIMKRHDRWRGFWQSLKFWKVDHLSDHSVRQYIAAILNAAIEERDKLQQGHTEVNPSDLVSCKLESA